MQGPCADVDKLTTATLDHSGQQTQTQLHCGEVVQRHGALIIVQSIGRIDNAAADGMPGIVHQYVDPLLGEFLQQPCDLVLLGQIARVPFAAGLCRECLEFIGTAGHSDHSRAPVAQLQDALTADPGGRPGDYDGQPTDITARAGDQGVDPIGKQRAALHKLLDGTANGHGDPLT